MAILNRKHVILFALETEKEKNQDGKVDGGEDQKSTPFPSRNQLTICTITGSGPIANMHGGGKHSEDQSRRPKQENV